MPRHGPPGDPHATGGGLGLLSALFPHDPSYEGLLSIDRINALKRMSLVRAGLGLMGASAPRPGGPTPFPAALAQNLGGAIGEFPQMLEGAAVSAGRIASFNREQEVLRSRREIVESTPQRAGESEIDWLRRLYPQFLRTGDIEVVGKLTELLKAAGDGSVTYREGVGAPGAPDAGRPGVFRLRERGPAERVPGIVPDDQKTPAQLALDEQRRFSRENALVDDYDRTVKPWLPGYNALLRATKWKDAALGNNGPAQIQLLYAFIQTLDNSVVREGEVSIMTGAASLWDQAKKLRNKIVQGKAQAVPPDMTAQMAAIVDALQSDFANRFDAWRAHYTRRAERWGVDPESFIDIPETFTPKKPIESY